MQYALIKNGQVENIIVADPDFVAELTGYDSIVDVTEFVATVGVGHSYSNGVFTAPEPTSIPIPTIMSRWEFRNRFTFDELVVIETAAETTPGVRVLKDNQAVAEYIDLTDPNTQLGIMYLVSIGLLTQERGTEILTP